MVSKEAGVTKENILKKFPFMERFIKLDKKGNEHLESIAVQTESLKEEFSKSSQTQEANTEHLESISNKTKDLSELQKKEAKTSVLLQKEQINNIENLCQCGSRIEMEFIYHKTFETGYLFHNPSVSSIPPSVCKINCIRVC